MESKYFKKREEPKKKGSEEDGSEPVYNKVIRNIIKTDHFISIQLSDNKTDLFI